MAELWQVKVGRTSHVADRHAVLTMCGKSYVEPAIRSVPTRRVKGATKCRRCRQAARATP